jgi:dihydrofolate synthase/folylpolyglutamate synthase
MCRDKNIREAVSKLIPHVDSFVTVDGFSDRAESKENLAEIINSLGGNAAPAQMSLTSEIAVMQSANPEGLNLICGSLFLCGELLNNSEFGMRNSEWA